MPRSEEGRNSSNVSIVRALGEFMELFPPIPQEQKRRMKTVLLPCFDLWFETRDDMIKSLLEWAEDADKVQEGYGSVASGTDTISVASSSARILGMAFNAVSQNFLAALHALTHITSAISAGAKAAEVVETRRITDKVNHALEQDRAESKSLEQLVDRYFRPNRQREDRAIEALVESTRSGAFNSVVAQTTINQLSSTYESYTADNDTSVHMLSACFDILNELQTNEAVDKSIKDKIAQFLHVNTVVLEVAQLCTREAGEIIIQCYVDAFVLPDVDPFLGIAIQSAFASYKVKKIFDYASRPRLSHEIRAIVADLKRVRDMLQRVRGVIENAEL